MKLQRYLAGRWVMLLVLMTVATSFAMLALTVVGSLRWTTTVPFAEVAAWVLLQWPAAIVRLLPASALFVTAVLLGGHVADRTLVAVAAGGVAPWRALWPWIPVLALGSLASLAASEWLVPAAERRATQVWWSMTEGRAPTFRLAGRDLWLPGGTHVRFAAHDEVADALRDVRVSVADGAMVDVWRAADATWVGDALHLRDATHVRLGLAALDATDLPPGDRLAALVPLHERFAARAVAVGETRWETEARYSGGTVGDGRALSRQFAVARDPRASAQERLVGALRGHEMLVSAAGVLALSLVAMAAIVRRSLGRAHSLAWAAGLGLAWLALGGIGHHVAYAAALPAAVAAWLPMLGVLLALPAALARRPQTRRAASAARAR